MLFRLGETLLLFSYFISAFAHVNTDRQNAGIVKNLKTLGTLHKISGYNQGDGQF